ncbi:TPA: hypothetical protein ACXOGQ_000867 [Serratia marcescens]
MTLTTERLKELADPNMICKCSDDEYQTMARELLANREAQPVAIVESSDYVTAAQIAGDEPRSKAVKELYEGALVIGQHLYTAPPALPVQHWEELCRQHPNMSIGDAIIRAAWWNHCRAELLNKGAPPAPAVVKLPTEFYSDEGIMVRLELVMAALALVGVKYERRGDACRAAMLAQPVSGGYKLPPHVYRELVNSIRDTAVKFSGTEQLRERLNTALSQFIEPDHPHTRTVAPEGGNGA